MPKRSHEHMEARRRQILDGARRAFAANGYEGATVAVLERETGMSRGAIFHHFPSKWDLFYALAQEDQSRAAELWLEQGYDAVLRHLADQSPDWLGVYVELARQFRSRPELRDRWAERNPELNRRLEEHLREQQRSGAIRGDVTLDDVATFLTVILDGISFRTSSGIHDDVDGLLHLVRAALAPPT